MMAAPAMSTDAPRGPLRAAEPATRENNVCALILSATYGVTLAAVSTSTDGAKADLALHTVSLETHATEIEPSKLHQVWQV